jgi:hypothetical protein
VAQGKKPPNPLYASDIDPLEYIELLDAIGGGAELGADAPIRRLTAVSFARLAEAAVEQNSKDLRQGSVGEFRTRARTFLESALAEECWFSGARASLDTLLETRDIRHEAFVAKVELFEPHYETMWREASRHCSLILSDIRISRARKGVKGRPMESRNGDALAQLLDSAILHDAVQAVPPGRPVDQQAVSQAIPSAVRVWTRLGQLRRLGDTEQEHVAYHTARLRALLEHLVKRGSGGGSSIIRPSK